MTVDGELLTLVAPMVLGIVAAIGKTKRVKADDKPLLALALGIVLGVALKFSTPLNGDDLRTGFVTGLVAALTAAGTWSGVDTMTSAKRRRV